MPEKINVGKVSNGILDYGRDVAGMMTTGALTGTMGEVGAVISYFISPAIASTDEGKTGNKIVAMLAFASAFLNRFTNVGRGAFD